MTALEPPPRLHSRYNPQGEAARYADTLPLNADNPPRCLLLIEPGGCYLVPPLREKLPGVSIIALHAAPPGPIPPENRPDAAWFPGSPQSLDSFLARRLPDDPAAVRLVEWRPSRAVYGDAYVRLLAGAAEFLKRADANARTTAHFGRRWFRNFFRNLPLLSPVILPPRLAGPIVVAAAGPSLEDTLPLLRDERRRGPLFVLAVSSAVAALTAAGVEPDLVVATDGGGWALLHLYACFRRPGPPPPLAVALTAALPSAAAGPGKLPLSDGSRWQTRVLAALRLPAIALPQRGTVAATALDLALRLTTGPVFFTGLDLAPRDLLSHARPHGFDHLQNPTRLNPGYSQAFHRAAGQDSSGGIYAAWFKEFFPALYQGRAYSLGGNHPVFRAYEAQLPRRPAEEDGVKALAAGLSDPETAAELRALLGTDELNEDSLRGFAEGDHHA